MPHFGFTSPWNWLAYRVGSLARVGVTGIVAEFRHLTERTRISSRAEKSAWMFRSAMSCVLVGAEGWLCLSLVPLGIVQTAIAFGSFVGGFVLSAEAYAPASSFWCPADNSRHDIGSAAAHRRIGARQ